MARIVVELVGKDSGATAVLEKANEAAIATGKAAEKTAQEFATSAQSINKSTKTVLYDLDALRKASLANYGPQAKIVQVNEELAETSAAAAKAQRIQAIATDSGSNAFTKLGRSLTKGLSGLRTLAYVLPGIGIAGIFDIAIQEITPFIIQLGILNKELSETEKNAQAARDVLKSLGEVQRKGEQDAQKELVTADSLYRATQNQNLSLKERGKAVDELQAKYPEYFKNIKDETILAGNASGAYDKLKGSIIATAIARAQENKIAQNSSKKIENDFNLLVKQQEIFRLQRENAQLAKNLTGGGESASGPELQIIANNKRIAANLKEQGEIKRANGTIDAINLALQTQIDAEVVKTGVAILANTTKISDQAKTLEDLKKDFQDAKDKLTVTLAESTISIRETTNKNLQNLLNKKFSIDTPLELKPKVALTFDEGNTDVDLSYFTTIFQKFAQDVNNMLDGAIADSAFNFGSSIGQAFADGGNIIEAAGKSLLASVGSILTDFGKLVIKAGIAALGLQLVFKDPLSPIAAAGAIAAGIALIAVGAAVAGFASQNKSSQNSSSSPTRRRPGFANGVENFRGGIALVGERGPELVNLPTGSGVIPNHKIEASLGRQNITINGSLGISMRELVLAIDRERSLQRRTG